MSENSSEYPSTSVTPTSGEKPVEKPKDKPKELNISEILQQRRADSAGSPDGVDLRNLLVQRTMERHSCSKEQALAVILAFSG